LSVAADASVTTITDPDAIATAMAIDQNELFSLFIGYSYQINQFGNEVPLFADLTP
jgi:hypothetical protein